MNRALHVISQRECGDGPAAWVVESGKMVPAREDNRRLTELRRGLARHPATRMRVADGDDMEVQRALGAVHSASYLETLSRVRSEAPILLPELTAPGLTPDIPVSEEIVRVAREGVRACTTAARLVSAGAYYAYAVSRPPGHHAGPAWFGGCCYLNNAAAAAVTLLVGGVGSVGILDLDFHYPNGTAAIVASLEHVVLHSLHTSRDPNAPRACAERGPAAEEFALAFDDPPEPASYLAAVSSSLRALTSGADAVVLSLGYDTLRNDPHGGWRFSPAIFARIGRLLAAAQTPICVVQEGGYSLGRLAACSHAFVSGLLDEPRRRRSPSWTRRPDAIPVRPGGYPRGSLR
jgi:acetoin utilization deacetylase AcuC-like enzyme